MGGAELWIKCKRAGRGGDTDADGMGQWGGTMPNGL
jgi:hypothetical protein